DLEIAKRAAPFCRVKISGSASTQVEPPKRLELSEKAVRQTHIPECQLFCCLKPRKIFLQHLSMIDPVRSLPTVLDDLPSSLQLRRHGLAYLCGSTRSRSARRYACPWTIPRMRVAHFAPAPCAVL